MRSDEQHPPKKVRYVGPNTHVPASIRLRKGPVQIDTSTMTRDSTRAALNTNTPLPAVSSDHNLNTKNTKSKAATSRSHSHTIQRNTRTPETDRNKHSTQTQGKHVHPLRESTRRPLEPQEDDGEMDDFIVDDVDNCNEMQSLIRDLVGRRTYDESREISFFDAVSWLMWGEAVESTGAQIDAEEEFSRLFREYEDRTAIL